MGLLGLDPASLQALMAQFQPSDQDKQRARTAALAAAGFGILGAKGVNGMQALGQGGLLGVQSYNQDLKDAQAQRMQNLQQAAALSKLAKDQQMQQYAMGLLAGGDSSPQGQASPAVPAQTYPLGTGAAPAAAPAGPMPPSQGNVMPAAPSFANPRAAMALALMGNQGAADIAMKSAAISQGPGGTLMRNGQLIGQITPQGTIIYKNGDPSQPQFFSQPQDALDAATKQAAAQAGATTAATEGAKQPFTLQSLQLPGGGTQQVFGDQLQALLRGGTGGMPVAAPSGMAGRSISPAQQAQDTKINEGFANDYSNIIDAEKNAPGNIGKYDLMKSYLSKVNTGKAAPSIQTLKSYAAYFAPDLAKSWTQDVPYAQAASALSNEIALQLRNPATGAGMPGSMSNSDRDFLTSMTASAANDPRAIPMMLDARIALEKRAQDIGQLARQYRQQNGKIDEGFYQKVQDFANNHPLFPQNMGMQSQVSTQVSNGATGTYKGKPVVFKDGKWQYQ